jgi:hypothetical protein
MRLDEMETSVDAAFGSGAHAEPAIALMLRLPHRDDRDRAASGCRTCEAAPWWRDPVEGGSMERVVRWMGGQVPRAVLMVLAACGANAPPFVEPRTVLVLQGLPAALSLTTGDPDADPLTFTVTRLPVHGSLSGTAPALTYTAASDYIGPDSFELTVSDGREDASATIGLSVEPVRGPPLENRAQLDALFLGLLRNLPSGGLSVAAAKDGKIVFARGYGHATSDAPMQPTSRSRIASVSKLVAMAAVMHLVEASLLHLDDRLLAVAPDLGPPLDPSAGAITIRNLLEHSSGLPDDLP